MIGGKGNNRTSPTALGSMLQAATYGQTIPQGYGLMKSPMLAVWAQNLRVGGSGKKFKQKKKGTTSYVENIDFLIGNNPIMGVFQFWENSTKLALNFVSQTSVVGGYGPHTVTISDSYFYAVVAVTVDTAYSYSFDDYGAPAPVSGSGTFETPLWNLAVAGPDPTNPSGYRNWPYVYSWTPAAGNVVSFPIACGGAFGSSAPLAPYTVNIYYAQLSTVLRRESPAAYLRFTFEPTLADGPEYTGDIDGTSTPLSTQQVLMPPFAGLGSADYDLGSSGAIPDVRPEVQFPFSIYSTGDADFADMIEDIVKSGLSQISPAETTVEDNNQMVQHGASAFDLPGCVQKKYASSSSTTIGSHTDSTYDQGNKPGNLLFSFWVGSGGSSAPTLSSTVEGAWNTIDNGAIATSPAVSWVAGYEFADGTAPGANTVSASNSTGATGITKFIAEIVNVDTFDTFAADTITGDDTSVVELTTGNALGQPALVIAISVNFFVDGYPSPGPLEADPTWDYFAGLPGYDYNEGTYAQSKIVWGPTTVRLKNVVTGQVPAGSNRLILVSFILKAPSIYPTPFGNFIDDASMQICRSQARAYGLWGSLSMQTQKACRDWMTNLYASMNSAPFYSGDVLKQMPYGEVSLAGNGAVYTAPTASGPIANLSYDNGDFLGNASNMPVTVERTAQFDAPNILQMQIFNRASDYNPVAVSQPEPGSLALYGVRKESPEVREEIADTGVARILLGIKVRRQAYIRNMLKFKCGPKAILYEPMDLVTLTEPLAALDDYPERFTSLEIGADWTAECEGEPYIYGVHSPVPVAATDLTPYVPNPIADPGNVNTPIIFEPVPRLYGSQSQAQLWAVISAASPNYAGCYVYISTDGGSSYNQVGTINGNGITGVTTSDWPIASDPDTTNNLPVNLDESLGTLSSYTTADRDNFTYPCYIAGGNASIPYGLMTYNSAVMTSANNYTLAATGTGNELRRCVYGAPVSQPGPDVDHPNGSRWAFLGNPALSSVPGVFKVTMDPKWIGTTLYFKFLPFNSFGNTAESLSAVTAYTYTPTGTPGGGIAQNQQYANTPALALSQTSTTNLAMAQVTTKFSSNSVIYNARSTIAVSTVITPTWFYVYIVDPSYTGDTGSSTNLSVQVDTTEVHLGVPGYTYLGAIQALASGFGNATVLPGGYPPPNVNIIGS